MIQILPMNNQEREKDLLTQNQLEKEDNARVLVMTEQENELGMVFVAVQDRKLIIFDFVLANGCDFDDLDMEEHFYVDTLMRSAASYGETNGARTIETVSPKYNNFLSKKKFDTDENHAFTPMSTIVHYT